MSWKRDQLNAARRLIAERRYDEARVLLGRIDDPRAKAWLSRIEARAGSAKGGRMSHTATAALIVLGVCAAVGLVYLVIAALNAA
jgi:hypothetical protein